MNTRTYETAMGMELRRYESGQTLFKGATVTPLITVPPGAVEYPDVSFYQGLIDFQKMAARTKMLLIRAGQNTWDDTQFERNYTQSAAHGLIRKVYFFYDDRVSPRSQADLLISMLKGREPEGEVVADWERNFGGGYFGLPYVCEFMQRVEDGLPKLRFLTEMYTGFYWFNDNSNPQTHAQQYAFLSLRNIHIAWYADAQYVRIPNPPWTNWQDWQFGTPPRGAEFGVESIEIDMNKFNGDDAALTARYGQVAPPQPPPNGGTMKIGTVVTNGLNIRSGPGTNYPQHLPPSGTLKKDDQVIGELDTATNWMHFTTILRTGGAQESWDGWSSAVGWNTPTPPYMTLADYTPPTGSSDIPMTLAWDESATHQGGSVSFVVKAK